MIYVVLGMHKSGTTLVARALHESGITMGQEFPRDGNYASLKYEARWAQEITDEILAMDRKRLSLEVRLKALPKNGIEEPMLQRMRQKVAEMETRYEDWGFKDPRAALTYRYWREALPPHRVIIIYRDPVEVWRRYARVNHRWWSRTAFQVWREYNQSILDSMPGLDPGNVLVLKFEDLLSREEEWTRLQQFVGRSLVDVRDPRQSRFRVKSNSGGRMFCNLMRWTAGAEVREAYRRLDALHTA